MESPRCTPASLPQATSGRYLDAAALAFPQTVFPKTHRRPSEILLILRGIAPGTTTARLAHALNRHRQHLLHLRHPLQDPARQAADPLPLDDPVVEADERFQNAGEKRPPAHRPRR